MPPKVKAAWWIEHAVKHKAAPHYKLSLSQRHDLAQAHIWDNTAGLVVSFVAVNTLVVSIVLLLYFKCYRVQAKPKLF